MHAIPTPTPWAPRALRACSVALVLFAFAMSAEGRTRHHHSSTAFKVALEPFTLVHAAVHAVAAPIVHNTPRLAFDAAAAPVRIAYHVSRDRTHPPRGRGSDGDGSGRVPSDAVDTPRRARLVDSAAYAEPIQVAYVVSPSSATQLPPHAEAAEEESEQPRNEEFSGTESTGSKPMVNGSRAILRRGIAFAPSQAPQAVKNAIWAANSLRSKPYVWGGGHGGFSDRGYDCSGTVSFALHGAGAIGSPMPSSDLMRYGERGCGRWLTIYARNGHTFAEIAGLRLDTTDFQNGGNTGPRWHADLRDTRGYVARHPAGM